MFVNVFISSINFVFPRELTKKLLQTHRKTDQSLISSSGIFTLFVFWFVDPFSLHPSNFIDRKIVISSLCIQCNRMAYGRRYKMLLMFVTFECFIQWTDCCEWISQWFKWIDDWNQFKRLTFRRWTMAGFRYGVGTFA